MASAAVTFCGIGVSRKRPDMADYASSLIGLGTILAYLCAYFTGPYYRILPDIGTFGLLTLLTALTYVLAMTFKTRIVAVISLFGGVLAPLFMAGAMGSHVTYLSYMLTLTVAMLLLSRRIGWPQLGSMSMVTSYLVIELVISFLPASKTASVGMTVLLHLFFYVFYIHNGFEILRYAFMTRMTAILSTSNIVFFLFSLNQVTTDDLNLGGLYLVNALIFAGFFYVTPLIIARADASKECKRFLQMVSLMSCGLLAGFGILALTDPELLGLIWGIESLILLAFGNRFSLLQVRVESYVVLALSFVVSGSHALAWIFDSLVPLPQIIDLEFGYGWVNLMFFWGLPAAFIFMMERSECPYRPFEKLWLYGWNEVISVCMSLAFLMTAGLFGSNCIWLLGIVPMFFLVFRSSRKNLPFTEYVGLAHFFLLAVPVLTSAWFVDSFYFSDQVLPGKIARVEAFLYLYAIAEFYRRFHGKSSLFPMINVLRQLFFCIIPVFFLPGVWHMFVYGFPLAMWGAAGICLILFGVLKYRSLEVELKLLVLGASLISIASCVFIKFAGWQGYGFQALFAGLGFFGILIFGLKGLEQAPQGSDAFLSFRDRVSFIFTLSFYYLGVCLLILVHAATGSTIVAFVVTTVWFFSLVLKLPGFPPLKGHETLLYVIVGSSAAILGLAHLLFFPNNGHLSAGIITVLYRYGIFNILVLGSYGLLVHLTYPHFENARERLGGPLPQFWIFHGLTCLTYIGVLRYCFTSAFGPALSVVLVFHATLVLFLTLTSRYQKLIRLAAVLFAVSAGKIVFFDMHDFSLMQKMIAFIVIGVLLLTGAFQYQRMKVKDAVSDYNGNAGPAGS